jgi:hypothetical protein
MFMELPTDTTNVIARSTGIIQSAIFMPILQVAVVAALIRDSSLNEASTI